MVILMYKEQAQLFIRASIRSFEMDMNYKLLAESTEKEIILAYFDPQIQRCKSIITN